MKGKDAMYTNPVGLTQTLSFRCEQSVGHLVRGASARRGEFVSEWLRRVVLQALENELADTGASERASAVQVGE